MCLLVYIDFLGKPVGGDLTVFCPVLQWETVTGQ